MSMSTASHVQDTRVDVRLVLAALWTATMFLFAYVDIFGLYRADVLHAALRGRVAGTAVAVDQQFLVLTLGYILLPTLMVVLSLLLSSRPGRILNLVVSLLYTASIAVSCIGEDQLYLLLGSIIEALLLLTIARRAWTWRSPVRNREAAGGWVA